MVKKDEDFNGSYNAIAGYLALNNKWLKDDIRQQMALMLWELESSEKEVDGALALTILKRRTIDWLKSKKVQYSYDNQFKHIPYNWGDVNEELMLGENPDRLEILVEEYFEEELVDRIFLESLLATLDKRTRTILMLRSYGYTLKQIGSLFGFSRSNTGKIVKNAYSLLRQAAEGYE